MRATSDDRQSLSVALITMSFGPSDSTVTVHETVRIASVADRCAEATSLNSSVSSSALVASGKIIAEAIHNTHDRPCARQPELIIVTPPPIWPDREFTRSSPP